MPRQTRKQLVGKQLENSERHEREGELHRLERALHSAWWQLQADQLDNPGDLG